MDIIPGYHNGSSESGLTPQVPPYGQSIIHPPQQPGTIQAFTKPPTAQLSSELPSQSTQAGSDSFRCHLCGRAYQRTDHLNRHLKNHENLRPHKCLQCPMRFNRADLLRRHRSSHDRQSPTRPRGDLVRPRGSCRERAAAACIACISSKTKCQDEKPCIGCQRRQIECESSPNTTLLRQQSTQLTTVANSEDVGDSSHGRLVSPQQHMSGQMSQVNVPASNGVDYAVFSNQPPNIVQQAQSHHLAPDFHDDADVANNMNRTFDLFDDPQVAYVDGDYQLDQGLSFMPRDAYLSQDIDFGLWDIDLEGVELAYQDFEHDQLDQGPVHLAETGQCNAFKTVSRRSTAFRQSTWIWTPTKNDQAMNDQNNLQLDEESIPSILTPSLCTIDADEFASCFTTAAKRNQILGILYTIRRDSIRFPSLPSLALLNKIIQVYFVTSNCWIDHMVHAASFDGAKALSQLLLAIIAAGSTLISASAIWKMGLALQEVVRHTVGEFVSCDEIRLLRFQLMMSLVGTR